jgi:hypothetical protein
MQVGARQQALEVTGDPVEVGLAALADDDRHREVELGERSTRGVPEAINSAGSSSPRSS